MRQSSSILLLLVAALLTACAGAPVDRARPDSFLADSLFAAPSERITTADVFAVDDAMRHYIAF
ncbi:MAG: hypothetical protein ABIV63_15530, partial [Caldimonas sp.]